MTNSGTSKDALTGDFIRFMLDSGVLKLGSFKTKSGRISPYFLDAGRYGRGSQLARLGGFYADRLLETLGDGFDVLFGPAYKGIPLAVATAMARSLPARMWGSAEAMLSNITCTRPPIKSSNAGALPR